MNRKAISERGWILLNCALLKNTEILKTEPKLVEVDDNDNNDNNQQELDSNNNNNNNNEMLQRRDDSGNNLLGVANIAATVNLVEGFFGSSMIDILQDALENKRVHINLHKQEEHAWTIRQEFIDDCQNMTAERLFKHSKVMLNIDVLNLQR